MLLEGRIEPLAQLVELVRAKLAAAFPAEASRYTPTAVKNIIVEIGIRKSGLAGSERRHPCRAPACDRRACAARRRGPAALRSLSLRPRQRQRRSGSPGMAPAAPAGPAAPRAAARPPLLDRPTPNAPCAELADSVDILEDADSGHLWAWELRDLRVSRRWGWLRRLHSRAAR